MIQKKWFQEITLCYLPVGHTHEKVDRDLFAPIGSEKRISRCETEPEFQQFVKGAFKHTKVKPVFNSKVLIWDWKAWLERNIRLMKKFSKYRTFRFYLDSFGNATFMIKPNILNSAWLGPQKSVVEGKRLFSTYINFRIYGFKSSSRWMHNINSSYCNC